jgi:nucleoside-diphosphate-sugar epimerase
MRLPQVHDRRRQGRIRWHIQIARERGRVAYVGEGRNRVPAAHVSDVARLFRLALERGTPGARYHAVAEEGVALREIAEVLGAGLRLPVESITPEQAPGYFGWLAPLAALDLPASSAQTRQQLDWVPAGPSLLTDLRDTGCDAI